MASGFTSGRWILLGSAKFNGTALSSRMAEGMKPGPPGIMCRPISRSFVTDFNFQITPGSASIADGFTFTIQGITPAQSARPAAALGYGASGGPGGIANSVAVKFDLYSNNGEGVDSTGLYRMDPGLRLQLST